MTNPYTSRGPVRQPEMFFGREQELRQIGAFLNSSQSVALIGPNEIGKTSLLFHLLRPATRASLGLGEENLLVYVDCEVLEESSGEAILSQFAAEIAAGLEERCLPPEPALGELIQKPSRQVFETAVRRMNGRGLRLVLLLDEFEHLSANSNLDAHFFNTLGSAAVRYGLVYLLATERPLVGLDRTRTHPTQTFLASPFFTIFAALYLDLLPEEDARRLIREPAAREGAGFTLEIENMIYELAGGHPEALQVACFHAFENPADQAEIERSTLEELESHFDAVWLGLELAEQEILCQLNHATTRATSDTTLRGMLRSLAQKCLLVSNGSAYTYPSRAWAGFVSERAAAQVSSPSSAPSTGWRFGSYEIIELLGRGGMAEVYKGRHTRLDRLVAIKIMPASLAEDEDFRQRFEREARAVAGLRHPNIVQVYDFGDVKGNAYIVMEYIQGPDLGHFMKTHGPLGLQAARPILNDLASALDYAHSRGIVHRDIKPSNVLIQTTVDSRSPSLREGTPTADQERTAAGGLPNIVRAASAVGIAFLSDFGIAKILRSDSTGATQTGLMMGTLSYMAPEQIRSAANVDHRADIYALGVMVYQMFTGRLPFQADNPGTVMLKHLTEPAPNPLDLRPDLPAPLASAILRALAKEPEERFSSVREMVGALQD